jgi:hypothetical protein
MHWEWAISEKFISLPKRNFEIEGVIIFFLKFLFGSRQV